MIVKVVIPDALYNRVYFARGEQGPQGATGPQGSPGATGATGPQGPAGANGVSYTPGDPIYVTVRNSTGSPLLKGSIVYVSGSNGNHVQVSLAQAVGDITSARTIGWVANTIPNNTEGLIMVEGYLEGLNTQGITAGAQLYLSPTVPGGFTETKPVAPDHMVYVGVAVKISAGDGHVYVKVQNGYELAEIHDVKITSPVNNQVLTYDSATDLWVNATNPADGVTSITASSPLTGGTITSTGSIGLNQSLLSITRSQVSDFAGGTVTSITGNITQSQVTGLVAELANDAKLNSANTFSVGGHRVENSVAGVVPLVLRGAVSQTGNLQEWQSDTGSIQARVTSGGSLVTTQGFAVLGGASISGSTAALFQSSSAGRIPVTVQGASGQTADLTQWQNSAGTVLAGMTAAGNLNVTQQVRVGGTSSLGQLSVTSLSAGNIGAVIRGAASQTANLQEWQNSAGTILARMTSAGVLRASQVLSFNGLSSMGEFNNGAIFEFVRATAQSYSPGANRATLYFRDGTNPSTLRLVVRAGTAGAETTILDNIPT